MKTIKAVILDCDGVMFDSRKSNEAYYNALLNHFKLPTMSPEQIIFAHANTVNKTLNHLIKNTSLLKEVKNYSKQLSYIDFIKKMKIEPTLFSTLKKLRPNVKTAIATNRTNTINQILKYYKLTQLFDFVICSSNVTLPKPHPEMLNKVIKHFGIKQKNAIYVGDSKIDELASNAADIPFIAYKNKTLCAIAHISSLYSIETIVLHKLTYKSYL